MLKPLLAEDDEYKSGLFCLIRALTAVYQFKLGYGYPNLFVFGIIKLESWFVCCSLKQTKITWSAYSNILMISGSKIILTIHGLNCDIIRNKTD